MSGSSLADSKAGPIALQTRGAKGEQALHEIVIVGGGAGGLELATRLGETLGKRKRARIRSLKSHGRTCGNRFFMRSQPEAWIRARKS